MLYTNDLARDNNRVFIKKYADDTMVVGLSDRKEDKEYLNSVNYVKVTFSEHKFG